MKFIVDNQLPQALAKWLRDRGADAVHVLERGQGQTEDQVIWQEAVAEQRIVVSKDEDFVILATRPGDGGRLLWLRVGNCRTGELITRLESVWADVENAFSSGQRILELR